MPGPSLRNLLVLTLLSKVCFFFLVFLGFHLLPFNAPAFNENFVSSNYSYSSWTLPLATWDAQHYICLAEKGYGPGQMSNNFFPLYPLLIKAFQPIFLENYFLTGLVLSNFLSFLMMTIFYLFVRKLFTPEIAFLSGVFMLVFPTHFYFNLVYTESLFLTLVLIFFYSLYMEKIFLTFFSAFLLPLAKAQGIFLVFPLLVFLIFQKRERRLTKQWFLIAGFALGVITYLFLMKYYTGSFFSGFTTQNEYVSANSIANIFNLKDWFLRNFIHITYTLHDFTTSIIDRLFFLCFLVLLYFVYTNKSAIYKSPRGLAPPYDFFSRTGTTSSVVLQGQSNVVSDSQIDNGPVSKKLDKTLFCYTFIMGVVPALMGSFMSYARYLLMVFPIFIVLALLLRQKSYFVIVPMVVLQVLFSLMHCLNFWVA